MPAGSKMLEKCTHFASFFVRDEKHVEEEFADVDKDGPVPVDVNLNDRPNVYISEFFFFTEN